MVLVTSTFTNSSSRLDAQGSAPALGYAFSEGAGATASDVSGNGRTGTLEYGAAWTASARFGAGLLLDGVDDGVQTPSAAGLDPTTAFTFEGWVSVSSAWGDGAIWARVSGPDAHKLVVVTGGQVDFGATFSDGYRSVRSPLPLAFNTWTHVAVTYDGMRLCLYVNAVEVAATAATGTLPAMASSHWFGSIDGADALSGRLDEVRIYTTARSAAEIALDLHTPVDAATPFQVGATTPADAAPGVLTTPIAAAFTRAVDAATVSGSAFELRDPSNAVVAATAAYDAGTRTATLMPSAALAPSTTYTARLIGGAAGVKDTDGASLPGDVAWTFETAAGAAAPSAAFAFNESGGTAAADASGNGNTGTLLQGTAWSAAGRFGGGLLLDGLDDVVRVPAGDALQLTTAFTFESWIRRTANAWHTIVHKHRPAEAAYRFEVTVDGYPRISGYFAGTFRFAQGATAVPLDTWTHVAATYEGAMLRVYVNGVEQATAPADGSVPVSPDPLGIGGMLVPSRTVAGSLDEVRIYRRALGPAEIVTDMNASIGDVTPPTVASTVPAPGAAGASLSAAVTATFDESLGAASVTTSTFELRDPSGSLVPATVTYTEATQTATLQPGSPLAEGATYAATLKGGSTGSTITDVAGNALAADHGWTFTTRVVDVSPPVVTGTTPLPSARNAALAGSVTAVFSEPVNASTLTDTTFYLRDTRNALVSGAVTYDAVTRTATFAPSAPLLATRPYTATIAGGGSGVRDLAGNPLAANHTWTFVSAVEPPRLAAGGSHSMAVDDAGQVWTWGANGSGQRGTGLDARVPGAVAVATGVRSVAAGDVHSLAVKSDGTLLAWGANGDGQLGIGSQTNQTSPQVVPGLATVIGVAAGRAHSVALQADGTVWAWGASGRVGDGANLRRTAPVQIASLSDVVAVAAGDDHSLALKADGTVWAWGVNTSGQAGDNTSTATHLAPVQTVNLSGVVGVAAGSTHSIAIVGGDLSLRAWGANGNGQLGNGAASGIARSPVVVTALSDVRAIEGGTTRSLASLLDGTTRVWGASALAGGGFSATPVVPPGAPASWQVAGGQYHSLAVTANGLVSAWGHSSSATAGQIGDGTQISRETAVAISEAPYVWKAGTPVFSLAAGTYSSIQNVTITSATSGATIRYTTDGADPIETDTLVPANGIVVVDRTLTLKSRAWRTAQPASNVAAADYVLQVAAPTLNPAGGTYTSAQNVGMSTTSAGAEIRYTTDGSDPTAGSTLYSGPVPVNTLTTLRARAFRPPMSPSTIVTRTYAFNYGTPAAPLVTPLSATYPTSVQVTMAAQPGITIRYTTDGSDPTETSTVYTAPLTLSGSSVVKARSFRVDYTPSVTRTVAYWVRLAGPILSPEAGSYPPGTTIMATSATPSARVHYTIDGRDPRESDPVLTVGAPLVVGNFTVKVRAFLVGAEPSAQVAATYSTTGTPGLGTVAAANHHSVALRPDGTVWAWGSNGPERRLGVLYCSAGAGQSLGPVATATPIASEATGIRAITVAHDSTAALRMDGRVVTWGGAFGGQLGHAQVSSTCSPIDTADRPTPREVAGLTDVTAIDGGFAFYVALKSDGTVWAWGQNGSGQLGDGTTTPSATPVRVGALTGVTMISAGQDHAMALRADGTVWGWGSNRNRKVDGSAASTRVTPVQVPGINNPAAIEAGWESSYAVLADGSVRTWGQIPAGLVPGASGSTPVPIPTLSGMVSVSGGAAASFALGQDGRVWAWGSNTNGLLGDPSVSTSRFTPGLVPGLPAIRAVAVSSHALAIAEDGSVWSWGWNPSGQVGDGTTANRFTAMPVLSAATMTPVEIATPGSLDPGIDVVHYYHTDAIGSVRVITDAARNVVARYDYTPFGEEFNPPSFRDPRMFGGAERDGESGLDYLGARYFEARIGRFLRPDDPGYADPANPQTLGLYGYVSNNPLRYVDPTGHFCESPESSTYTCVTGTAPPVENPGYLRFLLGADGVWPLPGTKGSHPSPIQTNGGNECPQVPPAPPGVDVKANVAAARASRNFVFAWPRLSWFRSQVQNRGPWDYKQLGPMYEDFGNFHYGMTGAAAGIQSQILLRAAGYAQGAAGTKTLQDGNWYDLSLNGPFGDDPRDQLQIRLGIDYYKAGCAK